MLFGALAPLVPGYAEEFGLSKTGAGLLVGAFGAGALLGGIPGGLAAARRGPKIAVVAGLVLLAASSFAFALADGPWALGLARFVQGFSSTTTWAGALAWLTVATPRERRGELLGTAFGAAVLGAILGPMFGAVADAVGIRGAFSTRRRDRRRARRLGRHPARRGARGAGTRRRPPRPPPTEASSAGSGSTPSPPGSSACSSCSSRSGSTTAASHRSRSAPSSSSPASSRWSSTRSLGRFSDRRGRLLPIRVALAASIVIAIAFAVTRDPYAVAVPDDPRGDLLRRLLHAGDGARLRPHRAGRAVAGDRVRDHEHRLGAREHERAVARGRARRGRRRRPPLPARAPPSAWSRCSATGSARAPTRVRVARGDSSAR